MAHTSYDYSTEWADALDAADYYDDYDRAEAEADARADAIADALDDYHADRADACRGVEAGDEDCDCAVVMAGDYRLDPIER